MQLIINDYVVMYLHNHEYITYGVVKYCYELELMRLRILKFGVVDNL